MEYRWTSDNGKWEVEITDARCSKRHAPEAEGYITDRRLRQYNSAWFVVSSRGGVSCVNYYPEQLKLDVSTFGTSLTEVPKYVRDKAVELANLAIIDARDSHGVWWSQAYRKPGKPKAMVGWGSFSGRQFQTIHADPGPYNMIERYVQWSLERNGLEADAAVFHARGQHDLARQREAQVQELAAALGNLARELGPRDYDYAENLLAKIQRGANVVWNRR